MQDKLELHKIEDSHDYAEKVNQLAGEITTQLMTGILAPQNNQQLENFIASNESLNQAIQSLDELWGRYSTLDVAAVHDIVKQNYPQTEEYVQENHIEPSTYTKVEPLYRDMTMYCMAYDIAKTIDHKIDKILDEDTKVVKV